MSTSTPSTRPWPWTPLILAILATVVVIVLWHVDPGRLAMPLCGLHAMTGLHCPGCGSTRAAHALLHGQVLTAMHQNALGVLSLPVVLYAAVSEWRRRRVGRPLPGNLAQRPALYLVFAGLMAVFFVLRNLPWYPLTLLAPL